MGVHRDECGGGLLLPLLRGDSTRPFHGYALILAVWVRKGEVLPRGGHLLSASGLLDHTPP
jgi:hypothetical protein